MQIGIGIKGFSLCRWLFSWCSTSHADSSVIDRAHFQRGDSGVVVWLWWWWIFFFSLSAIPDEPISPNFLLTHACESCIIQHGLCLNDGDERFSERTNRKCRRTFCESFLFWFTGGGGGGGGYKETTAGKSLRSVSIVIMIMKIRMMMMMMGTWHEISPHVKSRRFTWQISVSLSPSSVWKVTQPSK